MQGNSGKCYLILSTNEPAQIQTRQSLIESTNCKKLGGVKIDSKLSFDKHIKTICKKAKNKLRALASYTLYCYREEKGFNQLITVWMCHTCRNNIKIIIFMQNEFDLIYSNKKSC